MRLEEGGQFLQLAIGTQHRLQQLHALNNLDTPKHQPLDARERGGVRRGALEDVRIEGERLRGTLQPVEQLGLPQQARRFGLTTRILLESSASSTSSCATGFWRRP